MRAILIDDEQLMLDLLKDKITELSNIRVVGVYTNPHLGLIEISKQQPELVFLDISMPEVSGLELAKQIKTAMPKIKIIFTTAYDEYAVEAFEIDAEDYLLKPIEDARLSRTISRLMETEETLGHNVPIVRCFEKLTFGYDNNLDEILPVNWRTTKSKEVFVYLIHERGRFIRKDVLVDVFWPDLSIKDAFKQLYSTIYQIRKSLDLIGFDIQVISSESSYRLELNKCLIDVDVFDENIKNMPLITKDNIERHHEVIDLYKGDYFAEEGFIWTINEQNRLQIKWINQVKRIANYYIKNNQYEEAILMYLKYQRILPLYEESYFELMKLYAEYGERYAIENQYSLLSKMLRKEFDDEPSDEVVQWYNQLKI